MTSPEARAESTAREQFIKDKIRGDLKNFAVTVMDHPESFEVVFNPHELEGEPEVFGGEKALGTVVHYFVDKSTYRIIRRQFER